MRVIGAEAIKCRLEAGGPRKYDDDDHDLPRRKTGIVTTDRQRPSASS